MRVSNADKDRSHARIVAAAARLFRERGVEGASVAHIMGAAGMTHGGFYRHFPGKDALLAAALTAAFDDFAHPLLDAPEHQAPAAADAFRARYLSDDHRANPGEGCPAASVGTDIGRSDRKVRAAFDEGVGRIVDGLARARSGQADARSAALRDLAMMVGAIVLARAVEDDLARDILASCAAPAAV